MDGSGLYEAVYQFSHYAPLVILIAAALDIFFMTGLFLYGAAMMSTVLMMHMTGMIETEALIVSAFLGTVGGNLVNFWIGRWFSETEFIKTRLTRPRYQRAREHLRTRGLTLFMFIGRFVTFTRPLYALLLGSARISFKRFLWRELPLAFCWVTFWLLIVLQGEEWFERFAG